jgi:Arc/MetJ-type ribon-helix-helix transcriptional regulator
MERYPMSIELKPETERLIQEEIRTGHFQSVDELIVEGVRALREKTSAQFCGEDEHGPVDEAVARLRNLRKGVTLRGLRIKNLAHEGHRF